MAERKKKINPRDFVLAMINYTVDIGTAVYPPAALPGQVTKAALGTGVAAWDYTHEPGKQGDEGIEGEYKEVIEQAWQETVARHMGDLAHELNLTDEKNAYIRTIIPKFDSVDRVIDEASASWQHDLIRDEILDTIRKWHTGVQAGAVSQEGHVVISDNQFRAMAENMTNTLFERLRAGILDNHVLRSCYIEELALSKLEKISNDQQDLIRRLDQDKEEIFKNIRDEVNRINATDRNWDQHPFVYRITEIVDKAVQQVIQPHENMPQNTSPKEASEISARPSPEEIWAGHVRILTGALQINWKTRRLEKVVSENDVISLAELSKCQLRLLSVLVQGEGAVVNWQELYRRGVLMQTVIDRAEKIRENNRRAGFDYSGMTAGKSPREEVPFTHKGVFSSYYSEDVSEKDVKERVEEAVQELCHVSDALAAIIKRAERGYRILLQGDEKGFTGRPYSIHGRNWDANSDWEELERDIDERNKKYGDDDRWMRRYYSEVVGSFEHSITNAGGDRSSGADVFGGYAMTDVYSNAYAMTDDSGKTEAMLDYVERWYRGIDIGEDGSFSDSFASPHNKVLIIHGQPGDGKTTFCKKAVYAHCFEGWLAEAEGDKPSPRVLRISLNPNDSRDGIIDNGTLQLHKAICVFDKKAKKVYIRHLRKLEEGALVILDGYDELAGRLLAVDDASTFSEFLERAEEFAEDYKCRVIITSRTMCIKNDLEKEIKDNQKRKVVSFAPLTPVQQDMMIERMIELDRGRERRRGVQDTFCRSEGESLTSDSGQAVGRDNTLKEYKEKILPDLRETPAMKELLVIPTLFRMIVQSRFRPDGSIQTEAELYSRLFSNLMKYKKKKEREINGLLDEYSTFAISIFNYNDATCPFENEQIQGNRELVYLFFTESKTGQLGFLHTSFYQYFLARYIVNEIIRVAGLEEGSGRIPVGEAGMEAETLEGAFAKLFEGLRARKIADPFVWKLMEQTAMVRARELGDDGRSRLMRNLQAFTGYINSKHVLAEGIRSSNDYETEPNAGHDALTGAESAVFNLMGSLAAMEKGILRQAHPEEFRKAYEPVPTGDKKAPDQGLWRENDDIFDKVKIRDNWMPWAEIRKRKGIRYGDGNKKDGSRVGSGRGTGSLARSQTFSYGDAEDLLRRGVYSSLYMEGVNLGCCNLTGVRVDHANMEGACLANADFTDAHLAGSLLMKAELDGAVFRGADLSKANLSGAYMASSLNGNAGGKGAATESPGGVAATVRGGFSGTEQGKAGESVVQFSGTDFGGANLSGASLRGAGLPGAVFDGANLSGASLRGARLPGAVFDGANLSGGVNCTGADLRDVHFERADLSGADLSGADLRGAVFNYANLTGACLAKTSASNEGLDGEDLLGPRLSQASSRRETYFVRANMTGACLANARLEGTHMERARLGGADLKGARLTGAHLAACDLEGAILTGAVLCGADLKGACLRQAYLVRTGTDRKASWTEDVSFEEADLSGADLSGADIGGALMTEGLYREIKAKGVIGSPVIISETKKHKQPWSMNRSAGRVLSKLLSYGLESGDDQTWAPSDSVKELTVGGRIAFGRYSRETGGAKQPLYWRILRREGDRVLIITEDLIDCRRYHEELEDITWSDCSLCRWMNEDFIYEAFTPEEWARIDKRQIDNPDNKKYDTDGGGATWDRVFALSLEEAEKYFKNDADRMAALTPYAIGKGSYVNPDKNLPGGEPTGLWWLRSPGDFSLDAAIVLDGGGVRGYGSLVNDVSVSVRPALWLNL